MARNQYFRDELDYLAQVREEVARHSPDLAPFLAHRGNDPDVERLFEGFAFLAGRIREKLDDDFPELVHSIFDLWWPHYLRAIPSMSILEFRPVPQALTSRRRVPAGTEVQAVRVEGTQCVFRTATDVDLYPLSVAAVDLGETASGSRLEVQLDVATNAVFEAPTLDKLSLFLNGDPVVASTLYQWLARHVQRASVRLARQDAEVATLTLPPRTVTESGFAGGGALLPSTENVFPGYLLLQEYFCFPERFHFVDVNGLAAVGRKAQSERADSMTLVFDFDRPVPPGLRVSSDNVRLHCAPIVNLFDGTARPIVLDQRRAEYPLYAESNGGASTELYAVERVIVRDRKVGSQREFPRFESFEHHRNTQTHEAGAVTPVRGAYYRVRTGHAPSGTGTIARIAFVDESDRPTPPGEESVSIDLTCSNGALAGQLRPGDIRLATGTSPEYATFANLTRPSQYIAPPREAGLAWQLVSNMSLSYSTLLNTQALRNVLGTYDFKGRNDRQAALRCERILASLKVEQSRPADQLRRGMPIRGIATTLSLGGSAFGCTGDMYLFASVLNEFLSLFASINSFHELTVTDRDTGELFEWTAKPGQRPLI